MDTFLIKTPNLNLAATLLCIGFDIIGIDNLNPKKVSFLFSRTKELEQAIDDFWKDTIKVSPKQYDHARRDLLNRMNENDNT